MRKRLLILLMLLSAFLLTSCRVHFFGSSYEVPWFVVAVPCVLISLICILTAHVSIIRGNYVCPGCGNRFRPKRHEISAWIHLKGERVMRCPQCGRKGFCRRSDD